MECRGKARETYRVRTLMDMIAQRQKTLVFCANQAHAAAVRDPVNQMKTSTHADYCVRVTGLADDMATLGGKSRQIGAARNPPVRDASSGRVRRTLHASQAMLARRELSTVGDIPGVTA